MGGRGFALLALGAIVLWGVSGFFRVEPDEVGVVLRFGKEIREVQPGLNYHLPYPIETALTPKALQVRKIDIGMRIVDDLRRGTTVRDVPEESLMLTGDENIVDVDFSVLWRIKPNGVGDYLFNIQNPEGTVKAVAESAMREVVGRSDIQPILTGARQNIEVAVQELMQKTLDNYGAGVAVQQVQLQKVDPPQQVIDSFRDVQAARADLERAQNEAQTYANRVVPEARGRAAQILQGADAYKSQTVAEATGQTSRFSKIYEEYKKAPEVTRKRMYLETMERVLGGTDKIILDSNSQSGSGVVPYLPLTSCGGRQRPANAERRCPMRVGIAGGIVLVLVLAAIVLGYSSLFTVYQTQQALVVRLGQPVRVVTEPGLNFKVPLIDSVIGIDKRILDLENPAQEVIASDQKRLVVDAFARYRIQEPLRFYQTVNTVAGRQLAAFRAAQRGASARAGRGHAHPCGARRARAVDGAGARATRQGGAGLRHLGRRRANPPRRSAGTEQPGGVSAHADGAAARGRRVPRPGQPEVAGNPLQGRPRRDRAGRRGDLQVGAGPRRGRRRTKPHFRGSIRQGRRISSRSTARCRPTRRECATATPAWCCRRIRSSSAISSIRRASRAITLRRAAPGRRAVSAAGHPEITARGSTEGDGWRECPTFWSRSVWCLPSRGFCSPPFPGR